jgi:biopolymer transport protein TolR
MNLPSVSRRSQRRRPMSEINVVPYIDVSLVLLIIFMVTAPMLQTGVDVELPQASARAVPQDEQPPVILSIRADGSLYLDPGSQTDAPVAEAAIAGRIRDLLRNKPGLAVLIRGDRKVDYGRVVTLMAALKKAGVERVGLMTQPAGE